mmetsp:Transcript_16092/g.30630  ORF Transcript_16092/g.30630 Transcript_16092/m.30630 type:complete len:214 (-) Transcript_16092:419-1060(-)
MRLQHLVFFFFSFNTFLQIQSCGLMSRAIVSKTEKNPSKRDSTNLKAQATTIHVPRSSPCQWCSRLYWGPRQPLHYGEGYRRYQRHCKGKRKSNHMKGQCLERRNKKKYAGACHRGKEPTIWFPQQDWLTSRYQKQAADYCSERTDFDYIKILGHFNHCMRRFPARILGEFSRKDPKQMRHYGSTQGTCDDSTCREKKNVRDIEFHVHCHANG